MLIKDTEQRTRHQGPMKTVSGGLALTARLFRTNVQANDLIRASTSPQRAVAMPTMRTRATTQRRTASCPSDRSSFRLLYLRNLVK